MNEMPAPELDPAQPIRATPVMEQFIEIKAANPDSLLFYRMGDFYELFFDDAVDASRALGIVLTKRGKHLGEDIPMCGVPVSRADEYLQKLIALGFRVAVCEQLEDPAEARKRGAKSVVRRDVIRLVTPGTITEEALLDDGRANFLLAVARVKGDAEGARYGLAWADISSGAFRTLETDQRRLAAEIARIEPREIVLADRLFDDEALKPLWRAQRAAVTPLAAALFDGATANDRLARYFEVATIDGFGRFGRAELAAAAGIVAYVEKTQVGRRARLDRPSAEAAASVMLIDAASRANLELTRTTGGESRGSLLAAIDRTVTGPGRRLLADRLAGPSTDLALIERRLDAVGYLVDDAAAAGALADLLRRAPDMTRPLGRLALERGGPRDLAAIRAGLDAARAVLARLDAGSGLLPAELAEASAALADAPHDLAALLGRALADDVPLGRRDGGFIRAGFDPDLDETRALSADGRQLIARLEADYQAETGIRTLRIRHNNVLGYFIDTTPAHAERLGQPPHAARYIHRQTLANAVRFTTVELGDLESRIASAGERALALELARYDDLAAQVLAVADPIRAAADALAAIDVAQALARLAAAENWVRPNVSASLDFRIRGGRHPVVEQALRADGGEAFVANDCDLGPAGGERDGRLVVVTGPNMGGKSTYLRQNALIAVLAQIGAFVPAAEARIGLVDRLFSRVGAADDLARGRSTFMVEMIETAAILNQAGPRALVILDEIGRGTATFDGLSIAWAAIEHLNETNRCRALFATHYHELTALADRLPRIANATVRVREWKGDVVFLHEIVPGAADRSYGIQVARLAGLPEAVIKRARQVLKQLEEHDRKRPVATLIDDLPLFSAARRAPEPAAPTPALPEGPMRALADLAALAPDDLSPRDALEALYRLKAALAGWRP